MSQILPLIIIAVLLVGMITFSRRNKQRAAAADNARRQELMPGSEVMTTSGLYGTVVSINPDDSVLLSIAPGVEVKWAIAALRQVTELPEQYRAPIDQTANDPAPGTNSADSGSA
ncbi:MAG: preprotein translocase subunit YajC [Actinomycetota bacterium]|nr:preprotein translocase subunit YajC [Actinomycetota bacterium]MDQ2958187.1 preprotein translocase subunit YajC [Actinomycetota bacterium]